MRIGVVTDSTADLASERTDRFGIEVVPLCITWDDDTYLDRVELSTAEYYRRLRQSESLPTTGTPSPGAFQDAYRRQLERSDAVLSVHISTKLSATADVARIAAREVNETRITVFDSGSFSVGLGWLAETAAEMGEGGAPPWEIVQRLQSMASRLRIIAALDTLEGLVRGGRIGRARSLIGTLLQVKPLICIENGDVKPVAQARTSAAGRRMLVQTVLGLGAIERLGVVHGDAEDGAAWVEEALSAQLPHLQIDRGEIGSVIGTHAGPGAVAVGVLLAA